MRWKRLGRLLWKEYRVHRTLWLFAVALTVLGQLWVVARGVTDSGAAAEADLVLTWLLRLSVFGVLAFFFGSGAMSFGRETEEGTDEWLRRLAVGGGELLAAKLVTAVVGAASVLAAALVVPAGYWCVAAARGLVTSGLVSPTDLKLAAEFFLFGVGAFLWCAFFSLLTRHTLTSACLGAVASLASVYALISLPGSPESYLQAVTRWEWFVSLLWRAAVFLVALLAVDLLLTRWWLQRPLPTVWGWWRQRRGRLTWVSKRQWARVATEPQAVPGWWRRLTRLTRLEWRRAKTPAFLTLVGVLLVFGLVGWFDDRRWDRNWPVLALLALVAPTVLGVFSFDRSHRDADRSFLGERGVSPALVLLSKQLVWAPTVLVTTGLAVVLATAGAAAVAGEPEAGWSKLLAETLWGFTSLFRASLWSWNRVLWSRLSPATTLNEPFWVGGALLFGALRAVPVLLLAYAVSQLVAALVRNVVVALLLAWLLASQSVVLCVATPLPTKWAAWGLTAAVLVGAAVWCDEWLSGRPWSRRRVVRLLTWLGVPALFVVSTGWCHSLWSVPALPVRFEPEDVPQAATSDELATGREYRRLAKRLAAAQRSAALRKRRLSYSWQPLPAQTSRWLEERRPLLDELLACTRRPGCALLDPATAGEEDAWEQMDPRRSSRLGPLVRVLLLWARQAETEGQLAMALERYQAALRLCRHFAQKGTSWQYVLGRSLTECVYYYLSGWAAHPDQTDQLLRRAAEVVEREAARWPSVAAPVGVELKLALNSLEGRAVKKPGTSRHPTSRPRLFRWRARRQALTYFSISYDWLRDLAEGLQRPEFSFAVWVCEANHQWDRVWTGWRGLSEPSWFAFFFSQPPGRTDWWRREPFRLADYRLDQLARTAVSCEARRRALKLTLALVRYQRRHGTLPDRLDELVPEFLDRVPLDPWTGQSFGYCPRGLPGPVVPTPGTTVPTLLPEGHPFLWSPGAFAVRPARLETDQPSDTKPQYGLVDCFGRNVWQHTRAERAVWAHWAESAWPPWKHWSAWSDLWTKADVGLDFWGGALFPVPAGSSAAAQADTP